MTKANAKTADHKARSSAHNRQAPKPKSTALRKTKETLLREMLKRKSGASVDKLCNETSWKPHTVRAALSDLRKSGHRIERIRGDTGRFIYRIIAKAEADQ